MKHIFKGQGAPTFVPRHVGHHYIDTLNSISYISVGTNTVSDWRIAEATVSSVNGQIGDIVLTASDIGSTATGNISSTNVQSAIAELETEKQSVSEKGQPNGYASLDSGGKVPAFQLPSYVDDVVEYATLASFPVTGETGKIYVDLSTNKTYRWTGSIYVEVSSSPVTSVFGRIGTITATSGDYSASQITNTPAGNIASTTVQEAINELDSEKQPLDSTLTALASYNNNGILTQTAPDTFTGRTLIAGSGISITNADGVSGNPTISSTITQFTTEDAQDAVGNALVDSSSIDFTYNDAANTITATVIPGGVDHNSLLNYVGNQHVDHSAVSITAGTGLTGGGNITTSRTLSLANTTVVAGSYGSTTTVPTFTVDAQGRLTAASNTSIQITESQVTDLVSDLASKVSNTTQVIAGTGLTGGGALTGNVTLSLSNVGTSGTYGSSSQIPVITIDSQGRVTSVTPVSINAASIDHNSLSNLTTGDVHTQYVLLSGRSGGQIINGSVSASGTLTLTSTSNSTKGKIFLGSSNVLDEANNWLGVNTTSPRGALHVVGTDAAQVRGVINFHYSNDTTSSKATFGKARGTPASPSSVQTNDVLANYTFFGYGTTDFIQSAAIRAVAQQNFTDTTVGSQIEIQTTAVGGSTVQTALTIQSDKQVVASDAIRPGNSTNAVSGNIRYSGSDLEGYVGGSWKSLTANNLNYSRTASATLISTTSTAYTLVTGMTITPAAGTYLVFARIAASTTSNSRYIYASIFSGGSQVTDSETIGYVRTGASFLSNTDIVHLGTDAVVTVNGSQAVELQWKTSGGTAQGQGYSLILIKT